jgi:hypothetical protein
MQQTRRKGTREGQRTSLCDRFGKMSDRDAFGPKLIKPWGDGAQ